jgi:hypothetical protein
MINGVCIDSKHNNSNVASREHITSLIKRQLELDQAILESFDITSKIKKKVIHSSPIFEYTVTQEGPEQENQPEILPNPNQRLNRLNKYVSSRIAGIVATSINRSWETRSLQQ